MTNILGIDTSNYTTSICVYGESGILEEKRKLLCVDAGKRGLRQSDALFQHIKNLPNLLENISKYQIKGVSVSTKPRPEENSYMPVFLAGENIGKSIASSMGIPLIRTTHQEGHIESAMESLNLNISEFIAIHISGGTTEILKVKRSNEYNIHILGETEDISAGQFLDRVGVKMGYRFPAGHEVDKLAIKCRESSLRIPSSVRELSMNFSGQETKAIKYMELGYTNKEIAYAVMLCLSKSLQKICINLRKKYQLPIIILGGVSGSEFLKSYFKGLNMESIHFAKPSFGCDNAIGVAKIGYETLKKQEILK